MEWNVNSGSAYPHGHLSWWAAGGAEGGLKLPNHKGLEGASHEPRLQVAQRRRNVEMVLEDSWSCTPESSPPHCSRTFSLNLPSRREGKVIRFSSQSFNYFSLIPGSPTGNCFVELCFIWNYGLEPFLFNVGNKLCRNSTYTLGKELPIKHKQMFVLLYADLFVGAFVINCINSIWSSNN